MLRLALSINALSTRSLLYTARKTEFENRLNKAGQMAMFSFGRRSNNAQ